MDLFAFINHVDPTKVYIWEREVAEGEVLLVQLTRGRVVPLAGVNDQGNVNVQGNGDDDVNKGDGDASEANQTEQGEHGVDVGGIDAVADDKVQAIIADKPQRVSKKRKAVDGASGSGLPPKKLRKDHGTSGIGVNTGGKSVAALQSLLKGSTLPVEVGVTAVATMPFVTSSVTPDSISETGVRTQHPSKRFMISLYSSHNLNANVADDDVTSVIMSSMPPPLDFASPSLAKTDVAGPSQHVGTELSAGSLYVSQDTDPEILRQTYIPKWNVINDSVFDDLDVCQANWLKERDAKIANLKAQVSLKETEAANAIHLCGQVAVVEAARASELNGLKERNAVLEGQVATLESATLAKMPSLLSALKTTCSDLRTEVMRYKLFKEQIKAVQDVQVKANYVASMNALCGVDFPFLAQRASHKDSNQVVIGETSLYFSLDLAYARVQKLKESDASKQLSISEALVLIVESLSIGSLIGEANTSGVLAAIATTTLSTTFVEAGSIPPIPRTKAPPSSIVFEKEELDTTLEHPTAS
nr:hypothetical protein [Tanacetum cinerariifolium]